MPDNVAAQVARFPAELKPNPSYRYEAPHEVIVDGEKCIEIDAGVFPYVKSLSERSERAPKARTK